MTLDTFTKCLSKVPKSTTISFAGYAEPFLNRYSSQMIATAYANGYKVGLYTTLVGLTHQMVDEIAHIKFQTVQAHLPDSWGQMKADVNDHYIETAKYFLQKVGVNGSHVYGPLHEKLEGIFGHVERRNLDTDLHTRANNVKQEKIAVKHQDRHEGKIECDVVLRRKNGVKTLDFNVLLPNGNVTLCCMDYGLKHILGNLLTDSYESLFEGDEYKRIQAGLLDGDLDILCRTCKEAKPI